MSPIFAIATIAVVAGLVGTLVNDLFHYTPMTTLSTALAIAITGGIFCITG